MKKINFELIKDLFISILIAICIILIFSIIFYNKIALSKVVPESQEYALSEEMQKDLEDEYGQDNEEIVTTYYIKSSELNGYEKTKEYNKGKKNPFGIEKTETDTNSNNKENEENNNQNNNNANNNSSSNSNFYKDDGTK